MIETKTKEINGATYSVAQFSARRGLGLKTRLIKLIAPTAIAAMGSAGGKLTLESTVDSEVLSKAVKGLCENLDSDAVIKLIFDLLVSTRRNDIEVTGQNGAHFDDIYAANYSELYKALMFVIEVNFGSFFQELGIGNLDNSKPKELVKTPKK